MENLWMTIAFCAISFVCGIWLRDRILSWIGRG